ETGITQLGGHAIYLSPETIQLGKRETVHDAAKNFERWVDLIVARTFSHELVADLAKYASIPVINALTDLFHPCQALANALTVKEKFGKIEGLKLAYIGDGNNVANSLAAIYSKLGADFTIITPDAYRCPEPIIEKARISAVETGGSIKETSNPAEGVKGADMIYTDVWASMGQEKEAEERKKIFMPYQLNSGLTSKASPGCMICHCLPAHRGEEITSDVLDSPESSVFDEAENRLHVQKAVMLHLKGKSVL
ncbi:MAG: ornithine carbamoyltransferase, partial [Fibrobacterota bacterium]